MTRPSFRAASTFAASTFAASTLAASFVVALLFAGLLVGCDKLPDAASSTTSTAVQPESANAASHGADHGAAEHHTGMHAAQNQHMAMQADEDLHDHFAHKELVVLDDAGDVPQQFTEALKQMHTHYNEMAQALAADDAKAADAAAQKLRDQLENLKADGLDAPAESAWQGHRKVMAAGLGQR